MADTSTAQVPAEEKQQQQVEKTPGNIVSAGIPTKANFSATTEGFAQAANNGNATTTTEVKEEKAKESSAGETKELSTQQQAQVENKIPELSDDQLKEILKGKGISFDDFETLKQKIEYVPPAVALSEEDQKKADLETEKKLFNLHTKRGGTIEQFAAFKNLLATDAKELGIQKTILDLQKEGFSPEQAKAVAQKMHLQISDEDLALIEDEDERKLLQKERDFGLKKQENRGLYTKNTAKSYFDSLRQELQELEADKEKVAQHTAKAVDVIKNFQRKQTFQLGERDGVQLSPVESEVQEQTMNEVLEMVKDPVKLEKILYNKQGDLNLDFLVPHLINSLSMGKAIQDGFFTGETLAIDHIKANFSEKPPPLGGNGKPTGQKGKLVAAGQPEVFRPTTVKNN